jgi:uncharacterized protein (DUF433 family)
MPKKIISNPDVCNGTPVLEGTRVTAQTIIEFLAAGDNIEEILVEYPQLTQEDILECLSYASKAMSNHYDLVAI